MLLDGYMYLSPPFKQLILSEICAQLNAKYYEYCAAHPDFSGKVTLLAHSLGGVAAFDLLAHQHLLDGAYPPLGFPVSNLVLIGSPLPLFLELRECGERREAWPSETRLFNVFHPADPLGFLLEPSLMAVRVVGDGAADAVAVVEAEAAADGGDDGDAAVPAGGDAEATEAERLAAAAARAAAAAQERRRAAHRALRVRLLLAAEGGSTRRTPRQPSPPVMEEASALDAEAEEGALLAELDDDCLALGVGLDDGSARRAAWRRCRARAPPPSRTRCRRIVRRAPPLRARSSAPSSGRAVRGGRRAAARRSTVYCRRRPSTARARWWRRCALIGATGPRETSRSSSSRRLCRDGSTAPPPVQRSAPPMPSPRPPVGHQMSCMSPRAK